MSEEKKLILNLLSEGKITPDEAEELLEALEQDVAEKIESEPAQASESQKQKPKSKVEIGPELEDRMSEVASEIEELVSDIPEKVQRALDSVTITKDGKKSTLTDILKSWGISDIGGISANPTFRMGTADVKDRLPISVQLTNGAVAFVPNDENTDIKIISKVTVRNSAREEVQNIAKRHIEVFFDPKNGLKVRSIDNRDVNVAAVEVKLPKNLTYDISAQSVNGAVKMQSIGAKSAILKTVNGSISTQDCTLDTTDMQAVNGSVRLGGSFGDVAASTVNGSVRARMRLTGGSVRISSSNGSVKAFIDPEKSVPFELQASSRHGSVKMGLEGLETVQEASQYSMHKSGTWRSRGYLDAKVRSMVEIETRNGTVVLSPQEQ